MKICHFSAENANSVATFHSYFIKSGFLSTLGVPFLSLLYKAISNCPHSTVFVSFDENNLFIGFIAGTLSTKKMYKWIIIRYGIAFTVQLIAKVFNPSVLKKVFETLFYSLRKPQIHKSIDSIDIEAELLSIVVDSSNRGKGLGKKLVGDLENWYRGKGITSYKTVTWSKDTVSNQFYLACGFILDNSFTHHNNVMNVYIKNLA